MKKILGIDPGADGGLVLIDKEGKLLQKYTIPRIAGQVDLQELHKIIKTFNPEDTLVVIEQVHAIFGSAAGATFNFGKICGLLEGMIIALEFSYRLVQPKIWQKVMFQGLKEIRKPDKIMKNGKPKKGALETKKMALLAVGRYFPKIDFRPSERCKNQHNGLIDAALLAEYGRVTY